MRVTPICIMVLLAATPVLAQTDAQSNGGAHSNIGLARYPAARCVAPAPLAQQPPTPSPAVASIMAATPANSFIPQGQIPTHSLGSPQGEIAYYNHKILAYNEAARARNAAMQVYQDCIDAWLAAAKSDIARIDAAINETMAAADAAQNP